MDTAGMADAVGTVDMVDAEVPPWYANIRKQGNMRVVDAP